MKSTFFMDISFKKQIHKNDNAPSESISTLFALLCFHLLNGLCYATRKLLTYVLQTFDFWRNALGQNFPKNTRFCLNISGFLINSSIS